MVWTGSSHEAAEVPADAPLGLTVPSRWGARRALAAQELGALVRPVGWTWATTRALTWGIAMFSWLLVHRYAALPSHQAPAASVFTRVFASWDAFRFERIAQHGYASVGGSGAFYPAYPAFVGIVGRMLDGRYVLAGELVSLVATLAAFALLHRLVRRLTDDGTASRTVFYLAVFPVTFFLQALYSEALFLAVTAAAFLALSERRWLLVGVLAGGAVLTRPTGFALLAVVALAAALDRDRVRALPRVLVALPIFGLYPLVLWQQVHDPLAFLHSEAIWDRKLGPAGPFTGILRGTQAAADGIAQLTTGHVHWHNVHLAGVDPTLVSTINIEQFAYLVFAIALLVVAWRRLGWTYGLYGMLSLAIPLSTPPGPMPLMSMSRFVLVLFPVFAALALVTRSSRREQAVTVAFVLLLGLNVVRWVLNVWVA